MPFYMVFLSTLRGIGEVEEQNLLCHPFFIEVLLAFEFIGIVCQSGYDECYLLTGNLNP